MRNEDFVLNYNRPGRHTDRPKTESATWRGGGSSDVFSRSPEQLRAALKAQGIDANKIEVPKTHAEFEALDPILQSYILGSAPLAAKFDANLDAEAKKAAHDLKAKKLEKELSSDRWEKGNVTKAEFDRSHDVGMQFTQTYPQIVAADADTFRANANAIVAYIREKRLNPIELQSYAEAFHNLTLEGRLVLNPSKVKIGSRTDVGGQELLNLIHQHPEILDPFDSETMEKRRLNTMSSEEFLNNYEDPADREAILDGKYVDGGARKRQQIAAQEAGSYKHAVDSFKHLNPTYDSTSDNQDKLIAWLGERSLPMTASNLGVAFKDLVARKQMTPRETAEVRYGGTRMVGEGHTVTHGQATAAEAIAKQSLRTWVRNHSSAEIAERCRVEPSFRAALDNVND